MTETNAPAATQRIASAIRVVRGHKVLLAAELAALYGVATRVLVQAVRRNRERFPADFLFQLTDQEVVALRSQSVISDARPGRGGRRYRPYAFSEHGALMAATVLNTPRAVEMSLYIVRAFVRLREAAAANRALARKLDELEQRLHTHDQAIAEIVGAIRELTAVPEPKQRRIGFIQSD